MKKYLSFFLALILIAGLLSVGAAAAGDRVMVSRQNLRVDGVTILCEKYNINDRNYFKLRDLAQLVNGTGSQFDVDYDEEAGAMIVTTGQPYTHPNGTELKIGEDNSAKAKRSSQTLYIDGEKRSDLTAYNIDGTNFFQLRELEDILGFKVDYDQPSNTAIIISKMAPTPTEWLTEEYISKSNDGSSSRSVSVYNQEGRMISYRSENENYKEETVYRYDELGRQIGSDSTETWYGKSTRGTGTSSPSTSTPTMRTAENCPTPTAPTQGRAPRSTATTKTDISPGRNPPMWTTPSITPITSGTRRGGR